MAGGDVEYRLQASLVEPRPISYQVNEHATVPSAPKNTDEFLRRAQCDAGNAGAGGRPNPAPRSQR